eukprot:3997729-Amphidinium_carterae.1
MYGLAEKLVLRRIAAALGLDQTKFGFTGSRAFPHLLITQNDYSQASLQYCCETSWWLTAIRLRLMQDRTR